MKSMVEDHVMFYTKVSRVGIIPAEGREVHGGRPCDVIRNG